MRLSKVSVTGIRNIDSAQVSPSPSVNFIFGDNGSGKTSFLESLFLLGTGRSFRASSLRSVIGSEKREALVFSRLIGRAEDGVGVELEIELSQGIEISPAGKLRARQNGVSITSSSTLAHSLPIQLINSDAFLLVAGGPKFRRQYLDWGLFHVERSYAECWKRFNRCLKQRNQLLRYGKLSGLEQQLRPWDDELSVCAAQIHELRKQHVETLSPLIENKFEEMALVPGLDVIYKSGWDDSSVVYEEYLAKNFARDRALGYTKGGPHRADLRFMLDGLPATERLSRGQSKMLVCALKLVQGKILASAQRSEQEVVYLVDDLPSELDAQNREVFLSQLVGSKAQVFVTAVDDSSIPKRYVSDLNDSAMFHVKHGSFSRTR